MLCLLTTRSPPITCPLQTSPSPPPSCRAASASGAAMTNRMKMWCWKNLRSGRLCGWVCTAWERRLLADQLWVRMAGDPVHQGGKSGLRSRGGGYDLFRCHQSGALACRRELGERGGPACLASTRNCRLRRSAHTLSTAHWQKNQCAGHERRREAAWLARLRARAAAEEGRRRRSAAGERQRFQRRQEGGTRSLRRHAQESGGQACCSCGACGGGAAAGAAAAAGGNAGRQSGNAGCQSGAGSRG